MVDLFRLYIFFLFLVLLVYGNKLPGLRVYLKDTIRLSEGSFVPSINIKSISRRNEIHKINQESFRLRVFNEHGEYLAKVVDVGLLKDSVSLEIGSQLRSLSDDKTATQLNLIFVPSKKMPRLKTCIEACVALGVDAFYPIHTSKSSKSSDNRFSQHAQKQIRDAIIEGMTQSERLAPLPKYHSNGDQGNSLLSTVYGIIKANERGANGSATCETRIFLCVEPRFNDGQSVKPFIEALFTSPAQSYHDYIIIGPEGGFQENEIKELLAFKEVLPVSLNEGVLRSEVAAISAVSIYSCFYAQ